ncbi:hypothetical protein D3C87_1327690 [compost metagenome]|uniref:hypothetical protein n=1 Tax=Pseudomonas fluorescens TaxID=294 RepID=UPI000F955885|nr:hypothetical protein [Pseudomonas fluorescens]VVQ18138.1 hypothetical protein PS934_04602 [Pseudomonas fluorescens]
MELPEIMTKPSDGHVLSLALEVLVKSPLDQADDVSLISAATAVWYSSSDLETEVAAFLSCHSDELQLRRAGYLLERFTRFACVSDSRVLETLNALELFAHSISRQEVTLQSVIPLNQRRDVLAISWGLDEGLDLKVQTLMPYQTRHYAAEQRAM